MVLDTSAIIAILLNEPERHHFIRQIEAAPVRRLSAASRVESTLVIEGRKRDAGRDDLDLFRGRGRDRSGHAQAGRASPARPSADSVRAGTRPDAISAPRSPMRSHGHGRAAAVQGRRFRQDRHRERCLT
jgi:ribonuclease VapC